MNDTRMEQLHRTAFLMQVSGTTADVCNIVMAAIGRILKSSFRILALARGGRLIPVSIFPETEISLEHAVYFDECADSIFRSSETIIADDEQNSDVLAGPRADFQSALLVPMGEIGIIQIYSTQSRAYSAEDVLPLEILVANAVESIRRIRLKEELKSQVSHDPLTGVYNRLHLADLLGRESKRSDRFGHGLGLIVLDIDRFREINSRFGQHVGDEVLKLVASILVREARATDIVVRYGGDEFLLILPQTDAGADRLLARISASLEQNEALGRVVDFSITLTSGIAFWSPDQPQSVEETLTMAEQAMTKKRHQRIEPLNDIDQSTDTPLL